MPNLYLEKLRAEAQAKISLHEELLNTRQEHLQEIKAIDEELSKADITKAQEDIIEINKILNQLEPQAEEAEEDEVVEEESENEEE